jgi:competence protein ComEC
MPDHTDESEITVTFLDVRQSDSIVIILPDCNSAVVVDCSQSAAKTIDYLEEKGIGTLRYLFVTHTDFDHIGGAVELAQNFPPSGGIAYNHDTPRIVRGKRKIILRQLLQLSREQGFDTYSPRSGHKWDFQQVGIKALHPSDHNAKEAELKDDPNNASMILKVTFDNRRVLLAADVEGLGWKWVIERNTDLRADVFKFPHHGAWYDPSSQEPSLYEILNEVSPSLVIISVGTHNPYEHPADQTLKILREYPQMRFVCTQATQKCHSPLKNTSKDCPCAGTVEVVIGNDRMSVSPDPEEHLEIIKQFDTPQCNEV